MFNLAITGHVDHGKSTFIGHLLWLTNSLPRETLKELKKFSSEIEFAFLLDQFQEEREHAMTIDTTQVFFHSRKNRYVIIDTPGHVEFVKNMVTGVTKADASILIVSVEENLQTETKRHAYIVRLMGLKEILIIVNKMDKVNYSLEEFEKRQKELSSFLNSLNLTPLSIIPISAKCGDNMVSRSRNMDWYKGPTVLEAFEKFSLDKKKSLSPLRFPVQDIYEYDGENILVGRIESGDIKKGEKVVLLPSQREERVKALKLFGKEKKTAEKGESIGITLASGFSPLRGELLCTLECLPYVTTSIRSQVLWMSERPLKVKEIIKMRCTTQGVDSFVEKIENKIDSVAMKELGESQELRLNEIGQILLKTAQPVAVDKFSFINETGRFVLENNGHIEGGGIIIETS